MKKHIIFSVLLLAINKFVSSEYAFPGVVGRMNKKGFQFFEVVGKHWVSELLMRAKLPNVKHSPGSSYVIRDLSIESLNLGDFFLKPFPSDGLTGGFKEASIKVVGKLKRCRFEATSSGVEVQQNITLGVTDDGILSFTRGGCFASIESFDMIAKNCLWGKLYSFFLSTVKNKVRISMEEQICSTLQRIVKGSAEKFQRSATFIIPISYNISSDFRLIYPPVVNETFLTLYANGRCFSEELHFIPRHVFTTIKPSVPLPSPVSMVQVSVKDDVINSFLYSMFENELLCFNSNVEKIMTFFNATQIPDHLSNSMTSLNQSYGRSFQINVCLEAPPTVRFTTESVIVRGRLRAEGRSNRSNEENALIGAISTNIRLIGSCQSENDVIFASFNNITTSNTSFHGFSPEFVTSLMNGLVSSKLLSELNAVIADGYQLPHVVERAISHIRISLRENFLELGLDLTLHSSRYVQVKED